MRIPRNYSYFAGKEFGDILDTFIPRSATAKDVKEAGEFIREQAISYKNYDALSDRLKTSIQGSIATILDAGPRSKSNEAFYKAFAFGMGLMDGGNDSAVNAFIKRYGVSPNYGPWSGFTPMPADWAVGLSKAFAKKKARKPRPNYKAWGGFTPMPADWASGLALAVARSAPKTSVGGKPLRSAAGLFASLERNVGWGGATITPVGVLNGGTPLDNGGAFGTGRMNVQQVANSRPLPVPPPASGGPINPVETLRKFLYGGGPWGRKNSGASARGPQYRTRVNHWINLSSGTYNTQREQGFVDWFNLFSPDEVSYINGLINGKNQYEAVDALRNEYNALRGGGNNSNASPSPASMASGSQGAPGAASGALSIEEIKARMWNVAHGLPPAYGVNDANAAMKGINWSQMQQMSPYWHLAHHNFSGERQKSKFDKAVESIGKILPGIARPIMNIAKAMGEMASGVGQYGGAFVGGFGDIIGNPFDANVLNAVVDMGAQPAMMAGAFMSGVGGMISGVGEGIGRMANNAVAGNGGGNAGEGEAAGAGGGVGKVAGAVAIVGAVAGIVGSLIEAITKAIMAGFNIATSLLKSINKATLKILGTSPLLETIKNILNLAFTMAFLPMSTAILQEILPSILSLLDKAVEFGQSFRLTAEQTESIKQAFDEVITSVVDFFFNNADNLAKFIANGIKLLPMMMGLMLEIVETFVGEKDLIFDVCKETIQVMKEMISGGLLPKLLKFAQRTLKFFDTYGEKLATIAIKLAEWLVKVAGPVAGGVENVAEGSDSPAGRALKIAKYANPGIGGVNLLVDFVAGALSSFFHFASGGYVPATPGGVPCIIGEGGEGEYVIPESKMGGVTIVFSGNVYGMNDFKSQVRSIMNEYTTKANFR